MKDINIGVNNRIDVFWEDRYYRSTVQDIGTSFIAIAIPFRDGEFLPLRVGDSFIVTYYNKKEVYEFTTTVIERKIEKSVPLIYVTYPKQMKQIQRREYVRVETTYPIQYMKISDKTTLREAEIILKDKNGVNALMIDLSGGGLKAKFGEVLKLGDRMLISVPLKDSEMLLQGKIVRVESDGAGKFLDGIGFIELDRRIQEKIIQNIFQIMRAQKGSI